MTEHLSALDTMFLELEQADEGAHMHIGGALVFGPREDGTIPTIDELRERVGARLPRLPRFCQRLSSTHTSPLAWLTWEPVESVDLPAHLRHATLPAPGGEAELLEWLGDFWSHRLDRSRPLWEMTLLDGLADGGWVLATKTHHCLVDGVGSLDLGDILLDTEPGGRGGSGRAGRVGVGRATPRHDGSASWLAPASLIHTALAGAGALRHPVNTVAGVAAMTELLVREEVIAAPHSSLNDAMGGTRDFMVTRFPLAAVKAVKEAHGGTVNDVVLTLCAGGLRHLLLARGETPPERGLRAQVPVNIRSRDREHALGNELTSLFVELPVAEPDALARYQRVVDRAGSLKASSQVIGGKAMVDVSDAMPPAVGSWLGRTLLGGRRMFNLTITNVPGPQVQLYGMGAPLREILPLVPLFAGHAIGIAAMSYNGGLVFGINADRAGAPDAAELVRGIEASFAELRPSVRRSSRRPERV